MALLDRAEEKLKEIGYKPEQIEELKDLMVADVLEKVIADCAEVATPEELEQFSNEAGTTSGTENIASLIEKIAEKAYGPDYSTKLEAIVAEELMRAHDETLQMREKIQKYQAGDPETVAEVEALKNDPKVQEELAAMKAEGIDIEKEIVEAAQGSESQATEAPSMPDTSAPEAPVEAPQPGL